MIKLIEAHRSPIPLDFAFTEAMRTLEAFATAHGSVLVVDCSGGKAVHIRAENRRGKLVCIECGKRLRGVTKIGDQIGRGTPQLLVSYCEAHPTGAGSAVKPRGA